MKRVIVLVMLVVTIIAFTGCGGVTSDSFGHISYAIPSDVNVVEYGDNSTPFDNYVFYGNARNPEDLTKSVIISEYKFDSDTYNTITLDYDYYLNDAKEMAKENYNYEEYTVDWNRNTVDVLQYTYGKNSGYVTEIWFHYNSEVYYCIKCQSTDNTLGVDRIWESVSFVD